MAARNLENPETQRYRITAAELDALRTTIVRLVYCPTVRRVFIAATTAAIELGGTSFVITKPTPGLDVAPQVSSQIIDNPQPFILEHSLSTACEKSSGGAGAWPLCMPAFAFFVTNHCL